MQQTDPPSTTSLLSIRLLGPYQATVNGQPAAIDTDGCIVVEDLPATIEVVAGSRGKQ